MKKIELHAKTKYSFDKESTIDIEALLWNVKENGEKGIVFVDKDSIVSFPKIEKIYNKLCLQDVSFKKIKIGYGVQLTSIIHGIESEVIILVKKQQGLKVLYKIMSLYFNKYNKKIPINEILDHRDHLLVGIMLNEDNLRMDISMFDYLELNNPKYISKSEFKNKIIYSNIPNALYDRELKAKEVLYLHQQLNKSPECRLYLDTDTTLKKLNDKEIVITNSNMLFGNLENIIINDDKFYTTHIDNFDEFENLVRNKFIKKYKNPSNKTIKRLDEELYLVRKLDYTYYYDLLMIITNYCKNNKEYYQLDGYVNNSLIAYVLDLTEIEPYNLPYELFFSRIPKLEMIISPKFYHKKLFRFIMEKFGDKLIKCNYEFKLSTSTIPRVIKHYEIKTQSKLSSHEKDYIISLLNNTPLYKRESLNNAFFIIPDNMEIEDFTPYEVGTTFYKDNFKGTHYDYHDLNNNLIKMQFILQDDFENITNLINKTETKVQFYNDKKIYNLFRNTEEFNINFNILDKSTGLLNIRYFDTPEIEDKTTKISNIWLEDLIHILMNSNKGIIEDDLFNGLRNRNISDIDIFNTINYLKDSNKLITSKAFIINKIRLAYMQMYYKLYFPKEYYKEILSNITHQYIKEEVYNYSIKKIIYRYQELNEANKLSLSLEEYEEYKFLQILIEMYERKIDFKLIKNKIIIK